jgi:exodeoxyribonuclease-3
MRIATFNVNGVNGRLPRLLEWLEESSQTLPACRRSRPATHLSCASHRSGGIRRGLAWPAHPPWCCHSGPRCHSARSEAGLAGADDDSQARYLEAEVRGLTIASVYLPNGNPQPGPRFDYKLAWFERLISHARTLIDGGHDVVLAGDFNVVPTDADIYDAWWWRFDAVLQPQSRTAYQRLLAQGWVDATRHVHPDKRILHVLGQCRCVSPQRRLSHGLSVAKSGAQRSRAQKSIQTSRPRGGRATMRRSGLNWR